MALFTVSRYLGEDEDNNTTEKPGASEILNRLKREARARKRKLETVDHKTKPEPSSQDTEVTEHVKIEPDDHYERTEDQEIVVKKKKKRNHELSESDTILIDESKTNLISQGLDDTDISEVKKKHKKKKKETLSAYCNKDTNIDISETETVLRDSDSEMVSKKEKKKKKKHKKETSEEQEVNVTLGSDKDTSQSVASGDTNELAGEIDAKKTEETEEEKRELRSLHREVGGFTVIGRVKPARIEKVKRVLPDWLANPSVISADLTTDKLPVSEMPGLAQDLVQLLHDNDIKHFFPVQRQVIPALLGSSLTGYQIGRAGYRPSDICVSAPTGSGKTLAFVLPIVQALRSRLVCEVRALAVLPVTDLATQVYKVFQTYCKNTCLKVGLITGQKTLAVEQQTLIKKTLCGYRSQYDIIVATPGRLVDHLNKTHGFTLAHLRYLVIDEADRMMDEVKQDWLIQVENAVYQSRPRPGPLTAANCQRMDMPLQKLLYSATLSQNPEKLQQLNLFQPLLYTSLVTPGAGSQVQDGEDTNVQDGDNDDLMKMPSVPSEKSGDFVGKYATPASLTEYYIETTLGEKPLVLLHMLHNLNYKNILCFTNSVESTHRLYLLVKLVGGVVVKEFSSGLHVSRRDAILQKFVAGKIDILVCSDAMARGMDISTVKYVISYDPPVHIQTYIHRIGRTARAGQDGTAFTMLQKKEFFHFKKMIRESGKKDLRPLRITKQDVKPLVPKYEEALVKLAEILQAEKFRKIPKTGSQRKMDNKNTSGTRSPKKMDNKYTSETRSPKKMDNKNTSET